MTTTKSPIQILRDALTVAYDALVDAGLSTSNDYDAQIDQINRAFVATADEALRLTEGAQDAAAGAVPEGLEFHGYSDTDEHSGPTMAEYLKDRNDMDGMHSMAIGDEFTVTATYCRDEVWRVTDDVKYEAERVSPAATPSQGLPAAPSYIPEHWRKRAESIVSGERMKKDEQGRLAVMLLSTLLVNKPEAPAAAPSDPVAWKVGFDLYLTHEQAEANVRNPDLIPQPLFAAPPVQDAGKDALAELAPDCTRSHPHEDMDAECEAKTVQARADFKRAGVEHVKRADGAEDGGFESWWEAHGQFCRAGGGNYEKTFAYRAWQARGQQQVGVPDGWINDLRAIDRAMQHMGDTLNNMDAVEGGDEALATPGFDAIARLLAAAHAEPEAAP